MLAVEVLAFDTGGTIPAAAAADVGGGDRFDETENRALGRTYLAHMYRRYGSWHDAISAYNWGPGHLDE